MPQKLNKDVPTINGAMAFKFLEKFGSKPGLERISKLLETWGNPQDHMRVVLISGTNGKGSTTAFLSSILMQAGKKTGSFYSPHLLEFRERIQINGKMIPEAELEKLELEVKKYVDAEGEITYFEAAAACAYRYFAEQGVEYALMESGMGGRLDAVNAASEELAIITSIGFEHTKWLGSEISQIAYEKAGVMKNAKLAITGAGLGLETLKSEARKRGINLLAYGEDFEADVKKESLSGTMFDYSNEMQLAGMEIKMPGKFQVKNASLAVCAAENLECSENAIRAGLEKAKIRGRMEVLSKNPLIVADVAHNPSGTKALVDSLKALGHKKEEKIICVFSAMRDKNWKEMLKVLGEIVSVFVVCTPEGKERAEDAENLFLEAKKYAESYSSKSISDAVEFAKELANEDGMVLITGSIYMMEEVYYVLQNKKD